MSNGEPNTILTRIWRTVHMIPPPEVNQLQHVQRVICVKDQKEHLVVLLSLHPWSFKFNRRTPLAQNFIAGPLNVLVKMSLTTTIQTNLWDFSILLLESFARPISIFYSLCMMWIGLGWISSDYQGCCDQIRLSVWTAHWINWLSEKKSFWQGSSFWNIWVKLWRTTVFSAD